MYEKAMKPAEPLGSKTQLIPVGMTFVISLLAEFSLCVILTGTIIIALVAYAGN